MKFDYFPVNLGDVVVNLGAHRGGATKFYSEKVGTKGKVLSIEPEKTNYTSLHHVTKSLYNVWIYRLAIGDFTGKGILNVGTNSINHSTVRDFGGEVQEVQVVTWDELMMRERITEVAVAKIDVEGSEVECLRGMTHTFPKHIIMEEHSRFAYQLPELTNLLKEKGYMYVKEGLHIYAIR